MKLESEEIFFINALDAATGVIAKDTLVSEKLVTFLVKDPDMGKAIGPNGKNIRILSKKLNRRVELVAFFESVGEFFRKAMPETTFREISQGNDSLVLKVDSMSKRKIMSEMGKFKRIKKLAERNYSTGSIKLK